MPSAYITRTGYDRLSSELDQLLRVRRPEVTRAVSEAAALGDRSENAEYIYGKKLLREIDRRIRFLQNRLPKLNVIDQKPDNPERIYFGATILLENGAGEEITVRIVGADEFNPALHWISIDAPLSRALLGKAVDDEVKIGLPSGATETYCVLDITY